MFVGGSALAGFLIEVPNTGLNCTAWVGGRGVCAHARLVEAFAHGGGHGCDDLQHRACHKLRPRLSELIMAACMTRCFWLGYFCLTEGWFSPIVYL